MDLRVPIASAADTFGLPITVTRPDPYNDPVQTTGIWISTDHMGGGLVEPRPYGTDFQRREPRRLLAVTRNDQLPTLPRGSSVVAPEYLGGPAKTWTVDGLEHVEADCWRALLVPGS